MQNLAEVSTRFAPFVAIGGDLYGVHGWWWIVLHNHLIYVPRGPIFLLDSYASLGTSNQYSVYLSL